MPNSFLGTWRGRETPGICTPVRIEIGGICRGVESYRMLDRGKREKGANEVTQWVKALAAKPDYP